MSNPDYSISADFLPIADRRLFCIGLEPTRAPATSCVLFLHPFAEEMHKSRRTVARQARALAASGCHVLVPDLSGCGDSSGEFSDASWQQWQADAGHLIDSMRRRFGLPVTLWGLRLGALLACELASMRGDVDNLLMWQPALNGEQHIDQFLRFELAGQKLRGEAGFDRAGLWNELRSGKSLLVAGYELSATLALEISRVRLGDLAPQCPVRWIDVGTGRQQPNVASANVHQRWRDSGIMVEWEAIEGESFWRNVDAADSPQLIRHTVEALADE